MLDILVQPKRDKFAAERFVKLLHGTHQAPRQVLTDRLASYAQTCAEILPDAAHIRDKGANNRAEISHQSNRLRQCRMERFKSAHQAQRVVPTFSKNRKLVCIVMSFSLSG